MVVSSVDESPTMARAGVTGRVTLGDIRPTLVKRPVKRVSATLIALLRFDRRR
jgi:hypothetical protein